MIAWFVTGAFGTPPPPTPRATRVYISFTVSYMDPPDDQTQPSCEFPVRIDTVGSGIKNTILKPDGSLMTLLVQPSVKVTFTNVENGKSLTTPSANLIVTKKDAFGHVTLSTSKGLIWRIVVPGKGLVAADIGQFGYSKKYDTNGNFVSWQPISSGIRDGITVATLCPYLK
jgi:hypothetical protein